MFYFADVDTGSAYKDSRYTDRSVTIEGLQADKIGQFRLTKADSFGFCVTGGHSNKWAVCESKKTRICIVIAYGRSCL